MFSFVKNSILFTVESFLKYFNGYSYRKGVSFVNSFNEL